MNISIHTAQNVNIVYQPAGLPERIGATVIDLFLSGIVLLLCSLVLDSQAIPGKPIILGIAFIVVSTYHLFAEYFFQGRSIGKSILHLRVVRLDGKGLNFWDCLLRWVIRIIDISGSLGILAILSIIISSKMQRLGDLAAGTTVVRDNSLHTPQQLNIPEIPENYQAVFPQAVMLTDKDILVIKEVLKKVNTTGEYKLLTPLAQKIKELTGTESKLNNQQFVETILKDYTYLTR